MRVGSKKSSGTTKSGGARSSTKTTKGKTQTEAGSLSELTSAMTSESNSSDRVEVSDHVKAMEVIKSLVQNSPDIRSHEVDRIRNLLKNGNYKVNLERVAEAFIKDVIVNEIAKKNKRKIS